MMSNAVPTSHSRTLAVSMAGPSSLREDGDGWARQDFSAMADQSGFGLFDAHARLCLGYGMDRAIITKGKDQEEHKPHAHQSRRRSSVTDVAQFAFHSLKKTLPGITAAANKAALGMPDRPIRSGADAGGSPVIAMNELTTFYTARRADNHVPK